ncbi:hypothetical protein L596_006555 [Steinernema carpocapsae]|uniref:Uncharacterized protein n=1 Tax=Steinernema carpocapsae TaxID=34508 RepID=A0A4U8V2E4_STECR|nr:hypothetical protein L596_006555 [Steinernema carpocapsae]
MPSARPIDDIAEVTLFDKIMAGVRCSMRDCTGALRPTKKPFKAVLNSTVIRKARRNYEGCECSKTTRKPTSLN